MVTCHITSRRQRQESHRKTSTVQAGHMHSWSVLEQLCTQQHKDCSPDARILCMLRVDTDISVLVFSCLEVEIFLSSCEAGQAGPRYCPAEAVWSPEQTTKLVNTRPIPSADKTSVAGTGPQRCLVGLFVGHGNRPRVTDSYSWPWP